MTAPHDLDRQLSAFLEEGPAELPDPSFDAVRDHIESMHQRVFIGPWRFPDMNKLAVIGLGAAAVVLALVVGSRLLGPPGSSGVGGAPSPVPSATPAVTPRVSVVAPSSSSVASLPKGPFTVVDAQDPNPAVRFTVTVSDSGWTSVPDYAGVGKGTEVANVPEATILFWSWPAKTGFLVYADPCHWASTTPKTPATTVDQIATALATQASRDASAPVAVTVDGHAGKHIALHVPTDPASSSGCDNGDFASYGIAGEHGPARYHQGAGQIDELWVLDIDGAVAIIDAMYRPDTPAATIEQMRSIAGSARFE